MQADRLGDRVPAVSLETRALHEYMVFILLLCPAEFTRWRFVWSGSALKVIRLKHTGPDDKLELRGQSRR